MESEAAWKTAGPDQLASQKPADLDLQCFLKMICSSSAGQGLTFGKAHEVRFMSYNLFIDITSLVQCFFHSLRKIQGFKCFVGLLK